MAAPEPAAPARPDALPDAFWDEATGIKPEAYSRLAELEAADAARRAGVPESPDKYTLTLAEPIVGLDGKPVEFDAADPLAAAMLPVMHKLGMPQEAVSEILGVYAAQEIAAAQAQNDFIAAEQAKLGSSHAARTAAIHSAVTAAIGAPGADALRRNMGDAEGVIALEQLVSKLSGPALSAAPQPAPALPDLATRLYG
ncbi:hypothetical protein [Brevundimonas sp.]|uniref:hypothetical protein n=1 Tax=Brevundimonas sp. TaxID=1871086 RepID=UPI0025C102A1|nr:hypothetical protein [Brevundimonas sp.]